MEQYQFVVPCLFGLEGLAGEELRRLGLADVRVENGRVRFAGSLADLATVNLGLRTGERVLLLLAEFPAKTFEELFQGVYHAPLPSFIPKNGAFPVKGYCLESQLLSVPDCQAIVKKAAARRLGEAYGLTWLPEDGVVFQLQFSILHDQASLFLDTTGPGLHKRGYRAVGNDAPLRETLAAGMVELSHYRGRDFFWDPFCGSGTIPIEAALIAKNRAPGLNRSFAAERFPWLLEQVWKDARTAARDREFHGDYRILGSDNDPKCVSLAMANARKAGVADTVVFQDGDATAMKPPAAGGTLVCNPPYGVRMLEQESARRLYQAFGRRMAGLPEWKTYVITSEPEFERYFGRRADKKRKLYNGMILCNYYMYFQNPEERKGGAPHALSVHHQSRSGKT